MNVTIARLAAVFLVGLMAVPSVADARRRRGATVGVVPVSSTARKVRKVAWKATKKMVKRLRKLRYRVRMLPAARGSSMQRCLQQPSCVQTVGRRYRVRYLVAAHAEPVGHSLHVDMRVVSVKTGAVLVSDSFQTRNAWRMVGRSPAMAQRLLRSARRGVKVASAATATDAQYTPGPVTKSEAEAAAAVIEERDAEDPNAPPKKKVAKVTAAGAAISATGALTVTKRDDWSPSFFSGRYWHAWTTAGAGLTALGAGIAFGMISRSANDESRLAEHQPDTWTLQDKAQKNALMANICYAAGGAAMLTSAIMFYLEYRQERKEARRRQIGVGINVANNGGSVTIKGKF